MSSLTGGLSPDLGGAGAVKRPLEDAGDSGPRSEAGSKKYKQDLANLPTRQYLDQTVVPILLQVTTRRHLWARLQMITYLDTCTWNGHVLSLSHLYFARVWRV